MVYVSRFTIDRSIRLDCILPYLCIFHLACFILCNSWKACTLAPVHETGETAAATHRLSSDSLTVEVRGRGPCPDKATNPNRTGQLTFKSLHPNIPQPHELTRKQQKHFGKRNETDRDGARPTEITAANEDNHQQARYPELSVANMDESISSFVAITGATADVARGFLQIVNGDFERAIGLFYENPELASGVGAGIAEPTSGPANPTSSSRRRPNIGHEDASGIIHISDDDDDNDDDDDVMMVDDARSGDDGERAAVQHAAAMAQEEEDAAMAKRLQEELYQGNSAGPGAHDDVRAPIARTTETLVAPDPAWDGAVDDETTQRFLEQLRNRRHPPRKSLLFTTMGLFCL